MSGNPRTYAPDHLELIALPGIPEVSPGDDLAQLIVDACRASGQTLRHDDVLVIAQKVVSKAEGRVVQLSTVRPSAEAIDRARAVEKDARLLQLILDESNEVLRQRPGVIIVEHRLGFVMANAGIDQSNAGAGQAILLPSDPDASARRVRDALGTLCGAEIAVIVSDSIGRAWRNGTIGHALGVSGMKALLDLRGSPDMFGRPMQVTEVAVADEIAAAASLIMGQGGESKPVVIVRGFQPQADPDASVRDLLRNKEWDLFR